MKKTIYSLALCAIATVSAVTLTACSEKAAQVELKSVEYYTSHASEVEPFLTQCKVERNKTADPKVWEASNLAINCANAGNAAYAIYQKSLFDAANKYKLPHVRPK